MLVNQKVKIKGTNVYGYISVPTKVEIIWDNNNQKGHAMLNELEFVGNKFPSFSIKEREETT